MRIPILFIYLSLISTSVNSQIMFSSLNTENCFNKLPESCKKEIQSRESNKPLPNNLFVLCNEVSSAFPLHIIKSFNGIEQLGCSLFNDSIFSSYPKEACRFLERLFLESAIYDKVNFNKYLTESNISIKVGMLVNDNYNLLLQNLSDYNKPATNFFLGYDSSKYIAIWKNGIKQLSIVFPAKNTLLTGMDKKELDESLYFNLNNLTVKETLNTSKDFEIDKSIIKRIGNIYLIPGPSYFENISSDLYFSKSADSLNYDFLFDKKYFAESFSNLLLKPNKIGKSITVNIRQKQYGGIIKDFTINYAALVNYFSNCKYEAFVGIENRDAANLTATVIFFNKSVNNLNLLYIKTNAISVFAENIKFDATLYTNIPTDNIKNIFEDYTDSDFQHELKLK